MEYRGIFTFVFLCVLCVDARQVPGKPGRVTLRVINATAIHVSWEKPWRMEGDGIILGYIVHYKENPRVAPYISYEKSLDTMNGEKREVVIKGLRTDSRYFVSVSAYTRMGEGHKTRARQIKTKNIDGSPYWAWKQDFKVRRVKEDVILACYFRGQPWPTIEWFKEGQEIVADDTKYKTPRSRLRIRKLSIQDKGNYTCVVTNSQGSINWTYAVDVIQPPQSSTNLRVEARSPNEIDAHWEHAPDHDSIDSYILYYNDSIGQHYGEVNLTTISTSYTLTDLIPDTMYYIQLERRYRRGETVENELRHVRTPAYIPSEPTGVTVKAINSTAIQVSWEEPRRKWGDGIIRGYLVNYSERSTDDKTEQSMDTMNGEKMEMLLTGLKPDTTYSVSVSGYTRKGNGLRSNPELINTIGYGQWSEWGPWSPCTTTCEGGGTSTQKRRCLKTPEQAMCPGSDVYVDHYCSEDTACPEYRLNHCFGMYRKKKQTCARYIEHQFAHESGGLPKSINPHKCCSWMGGAGFSTIGYVKLKKNHFKCTSCEEWRRNNG